VPLNPVAPLRLLLTPQEHALTCHLNQKHSLSASGSISIDRVVRLAEKSMHEARCGFQHACDALQHSPAVHLIYMCQLLHVWASQTFQKAFTGFTQHGMMPSSPAGP
jgi:hypothetical protein